MSIGSAIAQGVNQATSTFEERRASVDRAKLEQQLAEEKLQDYQANRGVRESEAQLRLEQVENETAKLQAERLKLSTFNAFDAYDADGNVRHLNNFLSSAKTTQQGLASWGNWVRFDQVADTPEVRRQLANAGFEDPSDIFSDEELSKKYVLGTDTAGNQQLLDIDKLYQATGYARHMKQQQLEQMQTRASIEKLLIGEQSADTQLIRDIQEEQGGTLSDAAKTYYDMKNAGKGSGSTLERTADALMQQNPGMPRTEALRQASRTIAGPSAAEKDIALTSGIRNQLHELSDTGDFYSMDLSDPAKRARAGELITDLEKSTGRKLSDATKLTARNLRSLSRLGNTAGEELSDEETGIIDNMLYKVQKYFSDDIGGVEGASAYETFRNVFRNALYGASLTTAEISSFEAAAGNLKQKLGPVLGQLRTQMLDVKSQLQSVVDMEDPMIAYYYFGQSQEDLLNAVTQIGRRLEYFDSYKAEALKDGRSMTVREARIAPNPQTAKPTKSASERYKELIGAGNAN